MHAAPLSETPRRSGRLALWLIVAACALPPIASYFVYYFVRPDVRSNYGDLVEPQRPMPALALKTLDGRAVEAASLRGKWLMLMVADAACDASCKDRLYHLRQVRLTTGKDRDRVVRVWLIPDDAPLSTLTIREYDGTEMLRADRRQVAAWLADAGGTTDREPYDQRIFIVDPLGNLMMQFPVDADPNKTKRDLSKLLRASHIG